MRDDGGGIPTDMRTPALTPRPLVGVKQTYATVMTWIMLSLVWLIRTLNPAPPVWIGRSIGPIDWVLIMAVTKRGVGRALLEALIPRATALGKHVLIAGIDANNGGSMELHHRLGFEPVARFREVGRKFDRWLDLVFMQRFLGGTS